eukprot:m.222311 g.222311  ORF g.222311 m.222311 type:complete len:226 (-) comp16000_c0_seq1:25-702(-)
MNRLFGSGKPKAPAPTLGDVIGNAESRSELLEKKIGKLDQELVKFKDQMAKMRDGPGKNMVKQRALRVLKQKKTYEQQLMTLQAQTFNMEQVHYTQQSLADTQQTVGAMKAGLKTMKKDFKKIDISEVENMQDDIEDLLEMNEEIQESLARSYNAPEVDDADLEAEFEGLGDLTLDDNILDEAFAPSVPTHVPEAGAAVPAAAGPRKQPAGAVAVDEFGLPEAPS